MARAATLPQADASSLVDAGALEVKVREMYGERALNASSTYEVQSISLPAVKPA